MNTHTPEHFHRIEQLLSMLDQGKEPRDIALALGLTTNHVERYVFPRLSARREHERRRKVRKAFAEGKTCMFLAKDFGMEWRDVVSLVMDLSDRPVPFEDTKPAPDRAKQVMIRLDKPEDRIVVAQPTGRMEYCSAFYDPEKEWRFEAIDLADGVPKFFSWREVLHWAPR